MTEYIEREATKQLIGSRMTKVAAKSGDSKNEVIQGYMLGKDHAIDWVDQIPAADVVEVVRCEDCKHGQRNNIGFLKGRYICEYHKDDKILLSPRHYCAYGERKEQT